MGYLLYDETHCALQELLLRAQDSGKIVLHTWARIAESKGIKWQKKIIEALSVIKNYKILKYLGECFYCIFENIKSLTPSL